MPDEREVDLRLRLAAYVARQTARAAAYDRLKASAADLPQREYEPFAPAPARDSLDGPVAGTPRAEVTIVVPIHDAPEELRRCLWALLRNTSRPATLLLIDDASTDPRVDDLLAWAAGLEHVHVLRNTQNLGFPATVNRGLRAARGDVVLLNSDTEVGPRWLEQLARAASLDPATGSVTPLSDNAGAFSAPQIDVANPVPWNLGPDDAARLAAGQAGGGARLDAPTGNGFCLYLRRPLIDAVGEMDAARFPRGYGEETDYCVRAGRLGWRHAVDDRTLVHHARAASFGPAKPSLVADAKRRMSELHPDYGAKVTTFIGDERMAAARARVGGALARGARDGAPRPRVMFVVHEGGGGAVATNRDLMGALEDEYECYCMSSDRAVLRLSRIEGTRTEELDRWPLDRPLLLGDFSRPDYRAAFSEALDRVMPELVHVRHLFKHTFDPPRLTAARELPTVMSFHDHYFLCPTIHLLDERGRYCGGECTPGVGACPTVRAGTLPPLKHAFVHQWREEVEAALADVDAFVTTSEYTRGIHRRFLAVTRERPFELIEHGRDLDQHAGPAAAPKPGERIRILLPGHLDRHKGAGLIAEISALDRRRRLELHFVGDVPERYRGLGTVHGSYERDELARWVREIEPGFIGVLSVTGESYGHTITEAWAAGVPVLVTDLGAQAERVRARGGGFVISAQDPELALAQIIAAADDPTAYARERGLAGISGLPTVAEMAASYADLYREVLDRRRPFAAPGHDRASPLRHGIWPARVASPTGSLTARRLTHPGLRWKLRARADPASPPMQRGAELVHVAASPEGEPGAAAILFVDRAELGDDDGALLDASALVVVPSAQLATVWSRRHPAVAVLPPALDERLFVDGGAPLPPAHRPPAPDETVRLVCVESRPGVEELELLREVMKALGESGERRFALDLATCAELDPDAGWYRLVPLPDPDLAYGAHIRQLRRLRAGWHVGLAPQLGIDRGDLRFLEFAAVGLPGVYSATAERTIRPDVEGLVCGGEVQAWRGAIERLATDADLTETLRAGAWREVSARRLMRQNNLAVLDVLGRALAAPAHARRLEHAG